MTKKPKSEKKSESAQKPKSGSKKSARASMSVATSARKSIKERVAALAEVPLAVCENDKDLQAVLKVLRDESEPSEVRLAALQTLQAASFSVVSFESCRGDYMAALRAVAEDKDLELRQRVLGILARENDGFVQKKLLEGLENPEKALVSPEKALQLLSYDAHAEAYTAARKIISDPPNSSARREALRLLSADAASAPVFEKILRDKGESYEIRQISASALHSVEPDKLQENVREILLDTSEQEEIQAMSLTALTQFGDVQAVSDD
ncbi:MAG: hypothetical protein H7070_10675, partial [Saprospiraceae bacterium]|nr:hypothetical protein [Pyrinomonadaceae bacterium]